jgi:hypothetical protein
VRRQPAISYTPPPVDYLEPVWPPTRFPLQRLPSPVDWKDIVPIALRALWLSRPTAERAESAKAFAGMVRIWNADHGARLAATSEGLQSLTMDLSELDAQLDMTADLITRMVNAKPDDPDLLTMVAALQVSLEEKVGPALVDHIRARFQCLLGSLGLIPSDNEGEPCG